jgi:hypothetical protein
MDDGKHRTLPADTWRQTWAQTLPPEGAHPYPLLVSPDNLRRVRIDEDKWAAYAEVVGDGGRAPDIREYVDWRIAHPDTPLPGHWRGPVKKVRAKRRTGT